VADWDGRGRVPKGYTEADAERMLPERHDSSRSDFARDRARVLHSSGLRRLAAKTQVLSPFGDDFARNRLTHSLEVAQIGREMAFALGADPDIVDAACLSHDLGHPPFGHNGERALQEWAADIGGFEGNAQTLRLLTRLEPKVHDANGRSRGLNLTRAVLDACVKYPWTAEDAPSKATEGNPPGVAVKFGVYEDDREVFDWIRAGRTDQVTPVEAQLMDFADDVAYSVHDFEDAILNEFIDPELLDSRAGHDSLLDLVVEWAGGRYGRDELGEAFERIRSMPLWLRRWDGGHHDQARLKNFTSQLIGRFSHSAEEATRAEAKGRLRGRYHDTVVVPRHIQTEIAVLKGIAARFVMAIDSRQDGYERERTILLELADRLLELNGRVLDGAFRLAWSEAKNDQERKRVVVDQVASLTDQAATEWHSELVARRTV